MWSDLLGPRYTRITAWTDAVCFAKEDGVTGVHRFPGISLGIYASTYNR